MIIWRYFTNGTLDTAFNLNGYYTNPDGNASSNYLLADQSDQFLITGFISGGTNSNMSLWKINGLGALVSSFGNGGLITDVDAAGGTGADSGMGIARDASGRIYIAGYSTNSAGKFDMAVWRYTY